MIAKLASSNGASSQKASSRYSKVSTLSSTSKGKRSKLLNLLLNTNWFKESHQASNLLKLHKILLACDANFIDEKSGESPVSLVITSSQINGLQTSTKSSRLRPVGVGGRLPANGCSQSISLFDLQNQRSTTSHNRLTLQQTSAEEISQSKAPLVEKILLLFVKTGASIDIRNSDGRTPLHIAVMRSNFWALKTLLDLGAATSATDINGLTPIFYSILHKAELKVTQLLLNHMRGKQESSEGVYDGQTSDHLVSANGDHATMDIIDQHGWQAIHYAAKYGLSGHLEKLLYFGCDINAKISGSGNTPLHVAAINDQLQVAKVLLLRGADRTITNNSHQTAHQVAVISSSMNLAEFIASHDESKVVPLNNGLSSPIKRNSKPEISSTTNSTPQLVNSSFLPQNTVRNAPISHHETQTRIEMMQPQLQEKYVEQQQQQKVLQANQRLNPLTLDVANYYSCSTTSSAPTTNTSGTSHQTAQSSLLSIDSSCINNQQLNVQVNSISPSLSQRSCGTSNTTTTSSSGVCCDGENQNLENPSKNSRGHFSNITIISIRNSVDGIINNSSLSRKQNTTQLPQNTSNEERLKSVASSQNQQQVCNKNTKKQEFNKDLTTDESSSGDELYSLMSDRRPLFVGSLVKATNCYESGDPKHLQLRREDLVEILECPAELVQDGHLPKLANKPMLYGRRQLDGTCGLFPSFCVRRAKQKSPEPKRQPMKDITRLNNSLGQPHATVAVSADNSKNSIHTSGILSESQSMFVIGADTNGRILPSFDESLDYKSKHPDSSFKEFKVSLNKFNEGFGFVLRGARIDPATITAQPEDYFKASGRISIDASLMAANKLASLQYFSDIEPNSVAQKNGLKRGDFLVSVNSHDVRFCSHEQVVQMIRQSGDKVDLTIARNEPLISFSSKMLTRTKPEPPKRDPATTLTRNKTLRIKSMFVAPQLHQQERDLFDANKPLPDTPINALISSPVGLNRSVSTNLPQFSSIDSLNSPGQDSKSVTSISTVGSSQVPESSSSTTTLTTVATTKPKAVTKPDGILSTATLPMNKVSDHVDSKNQCNQNSSLCETGLMKDVGNSMNSNQNDPPNSNSPEQLPPPPPPLPNFLITPTRDRLNMRRTSAPINQVATPIQIDKEQLIKKRESLASIAIDGGLAAVRRPAPICAVAAACAAAANNRLQRQQQLQGKDESSNVEAHKMTQAKKIDYPRASNYSREVSAAPVADCKEIDAESVHVLENYDSSVQNLKVDIDSRKETSNLRTAQSATLGRKSSAQIIQRPKQGGNPLHSQTLKVAATKRMSILEYDAFPQPPSIPSPAPQLRTLDEPTGQLDRDQRLHQNSTHHNHHHHNQQTQCNRHTAIAQDDRYTTSQLQLQNQHQLLILRQQQQQQRQIQEQIKLHQQQQLRCQHNHRQELSYHAQDGLLHQHKHTDNVYNPRQDHIDELMTVHAAQHQNQSYVGQHQQTNHHHHHRHHQHPHSHSHLHHQHQQQVAQSHHRITAAQQHQHNYYYHNGGGRAAQYRVPLHQQQQHYLQNVNVDPRSAAQNR